MTPADLDPSAFLILNVDDTEAIRYAKSRALQRAGFRVVEAGTGSEALALAANQTPALALLDVRLPDISGTEVARRLKRDYPGMRVLQISAMAVSSADRVKGLESGADAYLVQPVSSDELVAAVGALLRVRRSQEALEAQVEQGERALRSEVEERGRVEAALRQAQKMEALGHLTGGIAHDFNNLLMAVMGNLEVLEKRLAQGRIDVQAQAANAMEAAQRAAALTKRLLGFARQQPLDAAVVDVRQLLAGLKPMIATTLGAIPVRTEVAEDLWPIWCDPHQLENALINLTINARDAMAEGGRLTLSARNLMLDQAAAAALPGCAPGPYVRIAVADTGAGMSPEVQAHAFDPFFTTKPKGQGTGLGLAMIYSFVRQSNGAIELESEPGRGTEVALFLPKAETQVAQAPAADQAPAAPRGRGETVLLVEDEPLVRQVLREALVEQGYRCLLAASAQEALALADGEAVDLLLTDLDLPGALDGLRLAEAMAAERPELKVVLISGHGAAEAPLPGEAVRLSKPVALETLSRTIAAALRT